MRSSFVSGEGLEVLGGSEEAVKSDLEKIHHENVDRLSRLSASEVMLERAQIEKALGETRTHVYIRGRVLNTGKEKNPLAHK